jgi:serine/threonine kinase 16
VLLNNKGEAVLTDFGSVDQARLQIRNRRDALALEERSMEQCTNLYRPPELFQVSSDCDIDERTDVWSLGCTIYAVMYGYSPFDGSATSAMSGKLNFPANKDKQQWEQIHSLLMKMLKIPPKERPFVPEILTEIGVQSPIK